MYLCEGSGPGISPICLDLRNQNIPPLTWSDFETNPFRNSNVWKKKSLGTNRSPTYEEFSDIDAYQKNYISKNYYNRKTLVKRTDNYVAVKTLKGGRYMKLKFQLQIQSHTNKII